MEINSPKTMVLRFLYMLWLVHHAAGIGAAFLCGQAFIFGYLFDPANPPAALMLPIGMFAVVSVPLSTLGRYLGVRFAQFREQEQFLQTCLGASWRGRRSYACQLERLAERIEASSGWERQRIRRIARRWLGRVLPNLSSDELDYATLHFGYLMPRA